MASSLDSFQRILSGVPKLNYGTEFDVSSVFAAAKSRYNMNLLDMYLGFDLEKQMNESNMTQSQYNTLMGKMKVFLNLAEEKFSDDK